MGELNAIALQEMLINPQLCGLVGRQHGSARREQLDHTVSSAGARRLSGVEWRRQEWAERGDVMDWFRRSQLEAGHFYAPRSIDRPLSLT